MRLRRQWLGLLMCLCIISTAVRVVSALDTPADVVLPPDVVSIEVVVPQMELLTGQTMQLTVRVTRMDTSVQDVTGSAGTTYTVLSNGVIAVSPGGLVTALARGLAMINVTHEQLGEVSVTRIVEFLVRIPDDADNDGIPDSFETQHGLNPNNAADGELDPDEDGLGNREEFLAGTDPNNADTDGDGFPDGLEVRNNMNPLAFDDGFPFPPAFVLDERCIVSVLNRNVRVQSDGTFVLTNIPAGSVLARARAICTDGDLVYGGESDFFRPVAGSANPIVFRSLGPIPPTIRSLAVSANPTTLTASGATSQITVMATFSDGSVRDVTAGAEGTTYTSSNMAFATVNADGLVTAGSQSGTVAVSITNNGVFAATMLTVTLTRDTDADGLPDDYELANGLNPNDDADAGQDPDSDGLTTLQEFMLGTDPRAADTDGDGVNDGVEATRGTNPTLADSDGDGLLDADEVTRGSNPLDPDSDDDGLPDGIEVMLAGDPRAAVPGNDDDGDGLSNLDEVQMFTNPRLPDTDGDGLTDGEEVLRGTNPLVPDSTPPVVTLTNPTAESEVREGQPLTLRATATDDGRVVRVDFRVGGQMVGSDTAEPYEFIFNVPFGTTTLTVDATAVDTNGNMATTPQVTVPVVPDPLTTVSGLVVDELGTRLANINIEVLGRTAVTGSNGSFTVTNVPTFSGDFVVVAQGRLEGRRAFGASPLLTPVPRGTTDAGMIVLTLAEGAVQDFYHFAANLGDTVTLSMDRVPNQGDGSSTLDPFVELRSSQGFVLALDDDSGGNLPPGPGRNALLSEVQLPATDTYMVVASGRGGTSGPYTLSLQTPAGRFLVRGDIRPQPPEADVVMFNGEIDMAGETMSHTFAASVNTTVTIAVRRVADLSEGTGTLDPAVELRDSRGVLLMEDDDTGTNDPPGPGRNALLPNLLLPATDAYTIVVKGTGGTVGPYVVDITIHP